MTSPPACRPPPLHEWRWGIDARVAGVMELEMGVYARVAGVMELERGVYARVAGVMELERGGNRQIYREDRIV